MRDTWELHGLTEQVGGRSVFLNLPAMGANPRRKDVFVEVDYMADAEHSHEPKPARQPCEFPLQVRAIVL